jgi:hypothetical protein
MHLSLWGNRGGGRSPHRPEPPKISPINPSGPKKDQNDISTPATVLHPVDPGAPPRCQSSSTSDIQPADGAFPRPTSSPPPELLHTRPPPRRRSFSLTLPTTELLLPNTRRSSGTGRLVGGRRRPRHRGFVCLGLPEDEDVEGSPSSKEDHAAGDSR